MLNTAANRVKFVEKFGCKHPRLPSYQVDDVAASRILGYIDRAPEVYQDWDKLWSFIMQDRRTYMIGEIRILPLYDQNKRVTPNRYEKIGKAVCQDIFDFISSL
jgi:hypothetical protein